MPIVTIEENTEENKVMKEMERKPYSLESMRVRCPQCRKLYMVQFADVQEAKPRFECIQCHTRFWLSLPDMDMASEMIGIPIQVKDVPAKTMRGTNEFNSKAEAKPCPKCFKPMAAGATECSHCGVIPAKMKELTFAEHGPSHSETLTLAWKKVIANYADEAVHNEFLRMAQRERGLAYAGAQYGQLLKLMPTDDTIKRRVREVQALASTIIPEVAPRATGRRHFPRIWQLPLMLAVVMILVGLILPVFRNIVGVGAAFLFLALALQIQTRRRS